MVRIAVLFDGAGLARLGLEQAGHECQGVELDPWKHHLSLFVGSGNCAIGDATRANLSSFDAVWASPPCARRSTAIKDLTKRGGLRKPEFQNDYLHWCLALPHDILWVENVQIQGGKGNEWGTMYNAAQFDARQNRNRVIGGRYPPPHVDFPYRRRLDGACPCISATEYKGCATDSLRASRFYGRRLNIQECAYRMGFEIPPGWYTIPDAFRPDDHQRLRVIHWERNLYEAIGNGVPPYMARAFGEAAK